MAHDNETVVDNREQHANRDLVIDDRGCSYDPYKPNFGLSESALLLIERIKVDKEKNAQSA